MLCCASVCDVALAVCRALRDKVQVLEDTVRAYHGIAEDMKMIPQSARNSRGENLVIDMDILAKKREALLKSAVKAHIVPILQDLKRELSESTLALRGELLSEKEALEELESRRHELLEAVELADQRIKRAEQAFRREKESLEAATELQRRDWDEAELRLLALRDTAAEEARINAATRRLAEIQALRRAKIADFEAKKTAMVEEVMEVVAACASHREAVQSGLEEVKARYGRRLESFLAPPPAMAGGTSSMLASSQNQRFSLRPPVATLGGRPSVAPARGASRPSLALGQPPVDHSRLSEAGYETGEELEVEEEDARAVATQLHGTFDRVARQQSHSGSEIL